ncbi:hypothetical protein ES703_36712 [subsurface metagenome]
MRLFGFWANLMIEIYDMFTYSFLCFLALIVIAVLLYRIVKDLEQKKKKK